MITLSWIAFFVNITAVLLSVYKKKSCWVVGIISCVLWICYAIPTGQVALAASQFVFIIINIYGFIKWFLDEVETGEY